MSWINVPFGAGGGARRLARVAKGFASPASRPQYVASARQQLRATVKRERAGERCLVCRAPAPRHDSVTFVRNKAKVVDVRICSHCGFIGAPDNRNDYRDRKNLENLPVAERIGTAERPGREFYMASMAAEILGRDNLDVLVYGVGRSFDNQHIAKLPEVRNVAIGDIMKFRDDAEFVDVTKPATRRFPMVIASEVVEHFRNPREEFARLFSFVERDGLLVCGTNVYDGGDLSKDRYLFYSDHSAYYSPQALMTLARAGGWYVDFRAPLIGAGTRKRYVLFAKSRKVMDSVAGYFGSHMYAPSEAQPASAPAVKQSRKPRRKQAAG